MKAFHALSAHLTSTACKLIVYRGRAWSFSFLAAKRTMDVFWPGLQGYRRPRLPIRSLAGMASSACRQELALLTPQAGETHQSGQGHPLLLIHGWGGPVPPSGMAPTATQIATRSPCQAWQQGQGCAVLTSGEGLVCFPSPVSTKHRHLQSWLLCQE